MKFRRTSLPVCLLLCLCLLFTACGREKTALTEPEAAAFQEILGVASTDGWQDITAKVMTKYLREKFPAVKKVWLTDEGDYAFVSKPYGYNAPITLAVVISGESGLTLGMRIVEHQETPHYVRDFVNAWFTNRFTGKDSSLYLKTVLLEAREDNEIVAVTGATVTSEGVVNGVNAAMGVYQEYVRERAMPSVPERPNGEYGEPELTETGVIEIIYQGEVIGEVTLEEIMALPSLQRQVTVNSTQGTSKHNLRGALLRDVLDLIDPEIKSSYSRVTTLGADSFISVIGMDEVRKENSVYVMYEDGGKPLSKRNGKDGAMWIIVLQDQFGQRYTNYLVQIILE